MITWLWSHDYKIYVNWHTENKMRRKLCHFCHQLWHFFQFLWIWWIFMVYTISVVAKRFLRIVKDVSKVVSNVWHRWTRFFLLLSELNITTNTSVILWRHKCHTFRTVTDLSTDSRTEFCIWPIWLAERVNQSASRTDYGWSMKWCLKWHIWFSRNKPCWK